MGLTPVLLEALEAEFSPRTIVLKNDSPVRELEGLKRETIIAKGDAGTVELIENGARFVADLAGGQKTGWFYDQRDNRRFMAGLAKDARVLDVFSYSGGFGVLAAKQGAKSVLCIDRSQPALDAAKAAASLNGVDRIVSFEKSEVFDALEKRQARSFDVVICDPPAFVKSRKDLKTAHRISSWCGSLHPVKRRLLLRRLLFAPRRSATVRRAGAPRPARRRPDRPHPAELGRRARPSRASKPARDRLSQGAHPAARLIMPF
jgi:hypothetical protein